MTEAKLRARARAVRWRGTWRERTARVRACHLRTTVEDLRAHVKLVDGQRWAAVREAARARTSCAEEGARAWREASELLNRFKVSAQTAAFCAGAAAGVALAVALAVIAKLVGG